MDSLGGLQHFGFGHLQPGGELSRCRDVFAFGLGSGGRELVKVAGAVEQLLPAGNREGFKSCTRRQLGERTDGHRQLTGCVVGSHPILRF
jgi:hypothetical protein